MRALGICFVLVMASGCSVLDQLDLSGGPRLDPNKVYLGSSVIVAPARDLHRYACTNGPMLCESHGISLECRCNY